MSERADREHEARTFARRKHKECDDRHATRRRSTSTRRVVGVLVVGVRHGLLVLLVLMMRWLLVLLVLVNRPARYLWLWLRLRLRWLLASQAADAQATRAVMVGTVLGEIVVLLQATVAAMRRRCPRAASVPSAHGRCDGSGRSALRMVMVVLRRRVVVVLLGMLMMMLRHCTGLLLSGGRLELWHQDSSSRIDEPVGDLADGQTREAAKAALLVLIWVRVVGVLHEPRA